MVVLPFALQCRSTTRVRKVRVESWARGQAVPGWLRLRDRSPARQVDSFPVHNVTPHLTTRCNGLAMKPSGVDNPVVASH
jgi:hypothetical protein